MTNERLNEIKEVEANSHSAVPYWNEKFLSLARTAIPELIDEVERLKVENDILKNYQYSEQQFLELYAQELYAQLRTWFTVVGNAEGGKKA